jgi:hypothetical protein
MGVKKDFLVRDLKREIHNRSSIPMESQSLIYVGRSMKDDQQLQDYGVDRNSTIIINLRLRGGLPGPIHGSTSFKDALKGKFVASGKSEQTLNIPGPYIVEQIKQILAMTIDLAESTNLRTTYQSQAIICRFNGFWPKPLDLFQWIFMTWTPNCEVHLCSKGFFIVKFESSEIREYVIQEGPWFWGNAGLFITPWFP